MGIQADVATVLFKRDPNDQVHVFSGAHLQLQLAAALLGTMHRQQPQT